jgi:hypothetical protein
MPVNYCESCGERYIYNPRRNPSASHAKYCKNCENEPASFDQIIINILDSENTSFIMPDILTNNTTELPEPKKSRPDVSSFPFEWIGDQVNTIADLIRLGRTYDPKKKIQTNLDLYRLSLLIDPLQELENMIGLSEIKSKMFDQIIFHLQNLDPGNKDMNHTTIKGPPGVGKTQLSHIIAKIYKNLGILKLDTVVVVKPDDFVAGYLGQTAIKTRKKLEEALGGVLLIDEAYSLGDEEGRDSFKKDALDLLTSFLSEHGNEFICIIAGYKDALEKRFFSMNEGLARRFTIHYEIKPYSQEDMARIFRKICSDASWSLIPEPTDLAPQFSSDIFPNYGGDCLSLFAYSKKAHSRRLLTIKTSEELEKAKKQLSHQDIIQGIKLYKEGNGYTDSKKAGPMHMYS